ncbi:hypothetical protein [Paraburkholderia youngii]|uniref:hypothetical protein n=1 Tax=Paraburkholderia youngii TaxID=2782701 RepID=UPI003D210F69
MSRDQKLAPLSLAQWFAGPEDAWVGRFGWLCGYSADADFLDLAAEFFTRQTAAQRAHAGSIALSVMLDAGNPAISMLEAPGVAHLPIRAEIEKRFALLHAKVALLGFRHRDRAGEWMVRLIVSTGNWTRQTIEESLDLAWCVDVYSRDLPEAHSPDEETLHRCADIEAARGMLERLSRLFDTRLLDAAAQVRERDTGLAIDDVSAWIAQCVKHAPNGVARFVHNEDESLLDQLPERIAQAGIDVASNRLAIGSGFYESAVQSNAVPTTLSAIVARLKTNKLLSANPAVDVFVNPRACQAVAQSAKAMNKANMTIRAAAQPATIFSDSQTRALHAKFLLGYKARNDSPYCLSAWVYLGSGNLTGPGFQRAARHGGNLEAGVVFSASDLVWSREQEFEPHHFVENVLPVHRRDTLEPDALSAGGDMPEREDAYLAAPVAWFAWHPTGDDSGELSVSDDARGAFEVVGVSGEACARKSGANIFLWHGLRPRVVSVRWQAGDRVAIADIPVVDEFGRVAAAALPALELEEAWWQLASFPQPPGDDVDGGDTDIDGTPHAAPPRGEHSRARYAVREMMNFIERLAERQTAVAEPYWSAWCCRLEQTLALLADSDGVRAFREMQLDPLAALRVESFRPTYAECGETPHGHAYEALLDRIGERWQMARAEPIGEAS